MSKIISKKRERKALVQSWKGGLGARKKYEIEITRKPVEQVEIPDGYEEPPTETIIVDGKPEEFFLEPSLKKKKHNAKYCKFLKGPHEYGDWEPYFYGFEKDKSKPNGVFVRYCKGCKRQDMWHAAWDTGLGWKISKEQRQTARPPGYVEK